VCLCGPDWGGAHGHAGARRSFRRNRCAADRHAGFCAGARRVRGARGLTLDYGFRQAGATGDRETVASVLANHGDRIGAAVMMLIDLEHRVVADTLGGASNCIEPVIFLQSIPCNKIVAG